MHAAPRTTVRACPSRGSKDGEGRAGGRGVSQIVFAAAVADSVGGGVFIVEYLATPARLREGGRTIIVPVGRALPRVPKAVLSLVSSPSHFVWASHTKEVTVWKQSRVPSLRPRDMSVAGTLSWCLSSA